MLTRAAAHVPEVVGFATKPRPARRVIRGVAASGTTLGLGRRGHGLWSEHSSTWCHAGGGHEFFVWDEPPAMLAKDVRGSGKAQRAPQRDYAPPFGGAFRWA